MGARRRKKSDDDHTASEDPWVPRWLPVLGNRQRHSDMGKEVKEKVQRKEGRVYQGYRSLNNSLEVSGKRKQKTLQMS